MTVENATTEATGEPGMHSEVKVLPGVDEAARAAVWTEVAAGAGPVDVVTTDIQRRLSEPVSAWHPMTTTYDNVERIHNWMKAITPDAKVFKAHLLELGYMFGQGELRTPHNHPSTPYLYRQTLETFDQPESRLHVCNGTAERPCGHTFGHLPRDQWPLHKKEVCPKCKLKRFEGDRDNLRPRAELFYLELEETLNTMLLSPGMQMWFNRDVDKGPGSFYASEAGKFMRDSVGADQFDNPYAVRLSLGIDWAETQSVGIIVLQVMDVPTKYMSKDETWAIVGVILGADKSKFVEGYVNQLLVDLRDSLDESKRDCWVHLHAPKGYRGANEATKIRLYPMLASVVADTPARMCLMKSLGHGACMNCAWCWLRTPGDGGVHPKGYWLPVEVLVPDLSRYPPPPTEEDAGVGAGVGRGGRHTGRAAGVVNGPGREGLRSQGAGQGGGQGVGQGANQGASQGAGLAAPQGDQGGQADRFEGRDEEAEGGDGEVGGGAAGGQGHDGEPVVGRGVVGEWFEAWMWDRRNRLSEEDMQTRGAAVEGGWVKGTDIGCWGRPIVTKYLKYVQAKWLHVVPIAHAFLFGVVKHHMQWLFSKSGPFSKRQGNDKESPRETMIKRFQDMHFPVTFGRRLKHTEDFTGWIMDDFMHFVRYGWQYVFRDIVTVENGHLPMWKALVKAVLHYLTSEGDPQRSPDMTPEAEALYEARLKAGMDEGADAIHTYAYLLAEKDWLGEDVPISLFSSNLHMLCCRLPDQERERGRACWVTEFFVERAMQRAKHFSGSHAAGLQVTLAMCLRERLSRQMQQWFNTHRHKHGRDAWAEEQEGEGMDEEGEENEEGREAAGQQGRKKSKGVRDAKPVPAEEVCQLLGCGYSECPNGGEGEEWVRQACIKFREEFLAESIEWSDADFNAVFADPVSGASPAVPQRVKYFKRAECNGQVMHSVDYTKVHVRNSNWVMNQYLQIIPGQYTGEHELVAVWGEVPYASHIQFWVRVEHPHKQGVFLRLAIARLYRTTPVPQLDTLAIARGTPLAEDDSATAEKRVPAKRKQPSRPTQRSKKQKADQQPAIVPSAAPPGTQGDGHEADSQEDEAPTQKLASPKHRFAQFVHTDGVALSVMFLRPKPAGPPAELPRLGRYMGAVNPLAHLHAEWMGVDPGTSNMATVAHEERSANGSVVSVKPQLKALSQVSSRPSSLASYRRFADTILATYDVMWAEVSKPCWANAKFRLYSDRILALAYGAAGFNGSGTIGCRGVPVEQMVKDALW
ncbi:hypothetical protein QJQ45_009822 [Haematococcus lacustris]|nr:hypothetical protein QJQ45_009822 [Haematococcus lacustris]